VLIAKSLLALALAAPPGLPGPPPGTGLPTSPGTAPAFVPPGAPAAIPATGGPGLLDAQRVRLNRAKRTFAVRLACQRNGTLRVRAPRLARTDLARTRYRCAAGRATATLRLTGKLAKRLARRRSVTATGIVGTARVTFELTAGLKPAAPKGFWTDGHLDCATGFLVEPDFTAASQIPISTRGWVAWYTEATGWHWLGSGGENAGRWNTWTASVSGVQQFHPNGTVVPGPWTLGPIAVPPGRGIYTAGVFEVVYWVGGRPDHQWQYVNAGSTGAVAAGGANPYCVQP
jgi:hypothetical protein